MTRLLSFFERKLRCACEFFENWETRNLIEQIIEKGKKLTLELKNPDNAPQPVGNYSNLAVVPKGHKLLLIAGQVGNLQNGELVE